MSKFLVVVDMQHDFIDGALGDSAAQEIVPKVAKKICGDRLNVVKKICGDRWDVIATLDTHGPDYLDTREGKMLPVKHCVKYTHGWCMPDQIIDALDVVQPYNVVCKPTFSSDEIVDIIKRSAPIFEPESDMYIQIVGLRTDICVISNAIMLRSAFPEAHIVVDSSCCAGTTPELHKAALDVMRSCHIEIE